MADEKKEIKRPKTVTLKPINIRWLMDKSFEESRPGNKVSDSEIVDRLIDAAREADESQSPTKQKKSARALEIAVAA